MNESSFGQKIDTGINAITHIPSSISNWYSGLRIRSPIQWPFGRGLTNDDKRLLASQDMPGLKVLLANIGRGSEWHDCDLYLKEFLMSGRKPIKEHGKLKSGYYPYIRQMGTVQADLIDELSASVAREFGRWNEDEEQEVRTKLRRSYYLNRKARGDVNFYIEAIDGIHKRLVKFFILVKDPLLKNQVETEYITSMRLLQKVFEQSGLELNFDRATGKVTFFDDNYEEENDDDLTDAQVKLLRKAHSMMNDTNNRPVSGGFSGLHRTQPPPIPKR